MDILTCTVGIMVVVAMFSAIESSDIQFQLFRPIWKEPDEGMRFRQVLVSEEGLRTMDIDAPVAEFVKLLSESDVTYETMPELADAFNKKRISDEWFNYSMEVSTTFNFPASTRSWVLIVNEKSSNRGVDQNPTEIETLRFLERLRHMDSKETWVRFLVAPESIELFRAARQVALDAGFLTGWDALDFTFPARVGLGGGESGPLKAGIQ